MGDGRAGMPEPQCDDGQVRARLQQVHGCRVPQRVRRYALAAERGAAPFGDGDGTVEPVAYPGAGQRCTGAVGDTGASGSAVIRFSQPRSSVAVFFHNGMTRCLRPLPCRWASAQGPTVRVPGQPVAGNLR